MKKLSELFNVNNFVVSQTNPYVIPFMEKTDFRNDTKNKRFMRLLKKLAFSEVAHRLS
jgi:TAG lipase/steryl ester hydrolase/phospholipase A2/LPA acyltransferase